MIEFKHMKQEIPTWIKIFGWILIVFGILFVFKACFAPTRIFADADMTQNVQRFFILGMVIRDIALIIGLALAILSNRPKPMALMLIIRFIIEFADLVMDINTRGLRILDITFIGIILIVEFGAIITLLKQIKANETTQSSITNT